MRAFGRRVSASGAAAPLAYRRRRATRIGPVAKELPEATPYANPSERGEELRHADGKLNAPVPGAGGQCRTPPQANHKRPAGGGVPV